MQNNLKSAFESMLLKAGAFFRRQQWKEILFFLFFLLLSFAFWLLQSLQQDYEYKVELPIRYKNVPSEWVLSASNPKNVNMLLKDKGTILMYYTWNAHINPVEISVSDLPRLSDYSLQVTSRSLEAAMSKQLISSTSILSIDPREIELRYDSLSSRVLPVVANVQVHAKPGFQLSDSIRLSHPEVRLYGSSRTLDTMTHVQTKWLTLNQASKTKDLTASLDLPEGVKADSETIKLTIPIEEFTEKKIELPVLCSDIPSGYLLRMFPSKVEVTCNIPVSKFRELTAEKLEIVIPFQEFEENQLTGKLPIRLTQKPAWVANSVINPNELEFIIEQITHD